MNLFFRKTGDGKPVVILHGLFGMTDNWQSFAKSLANKGYAVFTIDLRNHGQSFHNETFNYRVMAEDLYQFFSDEKIDNPSIIGHSMGGKTAMQYAFLHEDQINRLVVVDIAPRYYLPHHHAVLEALKAVDLSKIKSRKEAESVLDIFKLDFGTKQFLLKNLFWKTETNLAWRFNLPVIEKNIEEVGKEITSQEPFIKPALFIRGDQSNYIKDSDLEHIKMLFPVAKLITAPKAGHWVHADNPGWLLEEVLVFLKNGEMN